MPDWIWAAQLLAATVSRQSSTDWLARTDAGCLRLRPYAAIEDETCRLYQRVES
jgi:hypothetical protein